MAGGHYTKAVFKHNKPGEVDEEDPYLQADLRLTKALGEFIERSTYAGHPWLIEASHAQGVVMISLPTLMGRNKYVVHLYTLKGDPSLRAIMRGCGEILERYNIRRGSYSAADYVDAVMKVPKWRRGGAGLVPA